MMFNVKVLTIFPHLFPGSLGISVVGKALEKKIWNLEVINIRDFAIDKHNSVDDSPSGGGAGMVFRPDVLGNAIENAQKNFTNPKATVIYLSPRGKLLTQKLASKILVQKNIILICGRFEGVDQRVLDYYQAEELSIGNYILSGGETAAFVVIDTCVRLMPGVLGKDISNKEESFGTDTDYEDLVEYDQYTKPASWKGLKTPEILLSGNHEKIKKWRLENAKTRTKKYRPDL
ncbi:MAG: tRNA (guanosine(37)-N1)-methyltransferase TrmD [Rickettsiales bacterium]|nr:tRNA (guanosine(37)-N1)-methyltransferase TrmD [Rickettsiales bacterium]